MAIERTFSISSPMRPSAISTGAINAIIEKAGLAHRRAEAVAALRRARPRNSTPCTRERPFFGELVDFMISGAGRGAGAGRRERHREISRGHGRDRSGQGRRRHNSQDARQIDRRKLGARIGRARDRRSGRSRSSSRKMRSSAEGRFYDSGKTLRPRFWLLVPPVWPSRLILRRCCPGLAVKSTTLHLKGSRHVRTP